MEDDSFKNMAVYADFTVKDWWIREDIMHGDVNTFVEVESQFGEEYTLCFDPMKTPYQFGIGQKYTIFINPNLYGSFIIHAIQI